MKRIFALLLAVLLLLGGCGTAVDTEVDNGDMTEVTDAPETNAPETSISETSMTTVPVNVASEVEIVPPFSRSVPVNVLIEEIVDVPPESKIVPVKSEKSPASVAVLPARSNVPAPCAWFSDLK